MKICFPDYRQTLSGKLPYYHLRRDSEVLIELHQGVHPLRPPELADEHWALICRCWAEDPNARPDIKEVSECVQLYLKTSAVAVSDDTICQLADGQTLPSPDYTQTTLLHHDTADHAPSPTSTTATLVCAFITIYLLHHIIP
jgi:hypothetical protein